MPRRRTLTGRTERDRNRAAMRRNRVDFYLPNDMDNYMQYNLMGSVAQVSMMPGCLPSKFDCQIGSKRKGSDQNSAKKSRKKRVGERHDELVEIEIIKSEPKCESFNWESTEISSIKNEMENKEFTKDSRISNESETDNEGFSNTSGFKSEPNIDSKEFTKTTMENETTIENEPFTKTLSGTDISNVFIEISSIKKDPLD